MASDCATVLLLCFAAFATSHLGHGIGLMQHLEVIGCVILLTWCVAYPALPERQLGARAGPAFALLFAVMGPQETGKHVGKCAIFLDHLWEVE